MCRRKKNKNTEHELPKSCSFCEHAAIINDECNVLCDMHGIVNKEYACKKFVYDPLKRVPHVLPPLPTLSEEDMLI